MLTGAKWIKSPENNEEACYDFYLPINLSKKVKKASLSVSAIGMYCAFIDGVRVGDEIFTPYFTSYSRRTQFQTYDVTDMIKESFTLNILCSEGWAIGRVWGRCHYGDHISLIFSLDIEFSDGTHKSFVSDEKVSVFTSHILKSSIYDGETIDKTAEIKALGNALSDESVKANLIPQEGESVREQEIINPLSLIKTPKGETLIDFGQNLSGYVEITISGNRGDIIEISHAEVLDKDGNFYTDNLRTAAEKNKYILSGEGTEVFKPTFTWQGFRYIRLDKFPKESIDLSQFRAIAVYSDMKRTGDFVCGNEKINQLYHNVIWGQKSNFTDIPTDCPQRDERMGWTGDAAVFVRTAAINFDVEKFFKKWLHDLAADQRNDGAVQNVVPSLNPDLSCTDAKGTSSAWGDAAVICPWEIYMAYGNPDILANQFESMKKWIEYIRNFGSSEYLWLDGVHFGDWLGLDAEDGSYTGATSKDYIASAFYAYSTSLFIKAGKVLGKDMSEYETLHKNIVSAFLKEFTENGVPKAHTQTAFTLALCFDLCDKEKTAMELDRLVRENGNKLQTGFVGTPHLLYALSDNGYTDTAYKLLLQEDFPSWLYAVNKGATTMWEHWDGVKPDGSFWSSDMNSFNHYAYGSVFSWIFSVSGGIKPKEDGAGYKKVIIAPHPRKELGFLKTGIKTKYGYLSSHWYYDTNGNTHFEFEIPENTEAEIILPNRKTVNVNGGKYFFCI